MTEVYLMGSSGYHKTVRGARLPVKSSKGTPASKGRERLLATEREALMNAVRVIKLTESSYKTRGVGRG